MKKLFNLLFLFFFTGTLSVFAQKGMVELLTAGKDDAGKLIDGYINPFLNTFGNNLNNSWYNTAEPLKLGRFCVSLGMTTSLVPKDEKTFTIDPSNYSTISTTDNQPVSTQTVFGKNKSGETIYINYSTSGGNKQIPLALPKGLGMGVLPLPIAQVSVGLVKGTEIMLRVLPKINIGDRKFSYMGGGIKHSFKESIPVLKNAPIDLAIIAAYSHGNLELANGPFLSPQNGVTNTTTADYTDQIIKFGSNAWNANLIISKQFTVFTAFGGFRVSHYKTNLDLTGNYPITVYNNSGTKTINNLKDPISIDDSATQFGVNAGFRLKFGFFAFFADGIWSPGGYSSVTAGIGLGLFN